MSLSAQSIELVAGIFVGGRSTRMGRTKGLLAAPSGHPLTLVERLRNELTRALPGAACLLVGARQEYDCLKIPNLPDLVPDQGPLGGLVALLTHAQEEGAAAALVLACDLPFVRAELISRLALESPGSAIHCPYEDERYQPLFARYSAELLPSFSRALKEERRGLQPLLRQHRASVLELSEEESASLRDWDKPEDLLT